jgi:hypothetical protein
MLESPNMPTLFSPPVNAQPTPTTKRSALAPLKNVNSNMSAHAVERTPQKVTWIEPAKPYIKEESGLSDLLPSPSMPTMFSPLAASAQPVALPQHKKTVVKYSYARTPAMAPDFVPATPMTPEMPPATPANGPTPGAGKKGESEELFSPGTWYDVTTSIEKQPPPTRVQRLASGGIFASLVLSVALATSFALFPPVETTVISPASQLAIAPPPVSVFMAHASTERMPTSNLQQQLKESLEVVMDDVWTF